MIKISFIGLGTMGKGMALNLSKADCKYLVSDINESALQTFRDKGIECTADAKETMDSDIIFLCLPDEKVVEKVLFGFNGILTAPKKGQIIVDCSTINYLSAIDIAKRTEAKGVEYIDAPVSGMQKKAEDGTLAIMCGGKKEVFDMVKQYLDYMGTNVQYMGKSGNGQLTKMINNCIYDINCAAIAEMLAVAVKLGLDPEQIGSVVNSGTARSYSSEYFIPRILNGDFAYGFSMNAAYKDLLSAAEVCMAEAIPTPVLDATTTVYKTTMLKGHGHLYKGAMILPYEDLLNVKFRKKNTDDK